MSSILFDYAVKFKQIDGIQAPSFLFLHKVAVVVKATEENPTGTILLVTEQDELAKVSPDNADSVNALFDGGLYSVTLVFTDDCSDLATTLIDKESEFFTLACGCDVDAQAFIDNTDGWQAVRAVGGDDVDQLSEWAVLKNTCAFLTDDSGTFGDTYQMLYAFASLLAGALWRNQQYTSCNHLEGSVTTIGEAEDLYSKRISFFIDDETQGNRLGFFVAGGKSITTPYIKREIELTMQSNMLNHLAINQPYNVKTERAELERICGVIILRNIQRGYLDPDGVNEVEVTKSEDVFTVNGELKTTEAIALWRIKFDAYQL